MQLTNTVILACGAFLLGRAELADAQNYERVQPIVLTAASCCQSPANMTPPPIVRYQSGASYMSPSVSESIPPTLTESEMMPLPAGPAQLTTTSMMAPLVEYTALAPVVAPPESVQTLRPVSVPTVPVGYVVGEGLIGQPKLYKPGQPVRNFLRYISP